MRPRQTDSSLLDEWEQLTDPSVVAALAAAAEVRPGGLGDEPRPITANERAFRLLVRNAMFRRVELAALRRWNDLGELDADSGWDAERWREAIEDYFEEHDSIGTGPDARGPALLQVTRGPGRWLVRQVIDDPEGDHDWAITAVVDLAASDEAGEAAVTIKDFGPTAAV